MMSDRARKTRSRNVIGYYLTTFAGINIVVTRYTDGTVSTAKVVK